MYLNSIQDTSFKKIIVEGEYMWKNWFGARTQNNWVQVWNNLNGGNCEYMRKNWFGSRTLSARTQNNWVKVWNNLNGGNCWSKVKKHDKN